MKPQDLLFVILLIGLLVLRKPRFLVIAGLICLALAIPLFGFWIFFTAQRLTYYGVGFILTATLIYFWRAYKENN